MQSSATTTPSVNQLHQPSTCTIYDNNHPLQLTEKKSLFSSRIRLARQYLCPVNDNSITCQSLIDPCFQRLPFYTELIVILTGQDRTLRSFHSVVFSFILRRLIADQSLRRVHLREVQHGRSFLLNIDSLSTFSLHHLSSPLLITFDHSTTTNNESKFHLLCTDFQSSLTNNIDEFAAFFYALSTYNRQQHSSHLSTRRRKNNFTLASFLRQFIIESNEKHFLSLFATLENKHDIRSWTKLQQIVQQSEMLKSKEEIWVDGPLSTSQPSAEIWIDGPREFSSRSHKSRSRFKPLHTRPKLTLSSNLDGQDLSKTFDTESIVSSHCHLPVLPVFKDHSLLPFRHNQTPPTTKRIVVPPSPKLDLKLSTNQLNDDMEMLEKTLETLLIPSPIVSNRVDHRPQSPMSQSLHRINQLSSLMSTDEKNHRLSRIVSPTRFDKLFISSQSPESPPPSMPNSPLLVSKVRHSRNPCASSTPTHTASMKKPKAPQRTTSLADANRPHLSLPRPSIFQRLFGLRSSTSTSHAVPLPATSPPSSPLICPLTVTLDSHDDLMPLTTSSTASSASGRASSSGYESIGNTILDEMTNHGYNSIKTRNKSTKKTHWNSPNPRLSQLKHRQNELKLELAMTKTFLSMDKSKHHESIENHPSPVHLSNYDEEMELEKDIDYLERRLASAKSQLLFITSQKQKPNSKS